MAHFRYFKIVPIFFSILIFFSCSGRKQRYLMDKINYDTVFFYKNTHIDDYRLRPSDVLYIKILTTDDRINSLFNIGDNASNNSRANSGGEFFLSGFTVNDSGFIKVPVLGKFPVMGKSMPEIRMLVQERTDFFLKNAITNVYMVSYKVSFLGEVSKQGPMYIYQEKLDLVEALSRVGGVTPTADLTRVRIIRPTSDGFSERMVDLTKAEFLTNEALILQPNDLVIVDPIKMKMFRQSTQDYFTVISLLTSTLTTIFLIISLSR